MDFSVALRRAARDYRFLLDSGYPVNASIKLVGDRWRLDRDQRIVLFRGVLSAADSDSIRSRLVSTLPPGARLAVDGYNVLFTLVNYRRGHPLFIGTDGLLRDAGGAHGRIQRAEDMKEAIGLLVVRLGGLAPAETRVFLDAPVSGSAGHAVALRVALAGAGVSGGAETRASADPAVRDWDGGVASSSDSAIVRFAKSPVFDLSRDILEHAYGARFERLEEWMG